MKTSASLLRVVLLGLSLLALPAAGWAQASKPGWSTEAAKSMEKAKAERKMVLIDFTGSDWCPWCVKMDKEVFSTPEFIKYAKDNLVLLEADFPNNKYQSPQLKEQNKALKDQFAVRGFPTTIVLGADGNRLKQFGGYQAGGAGAFIAQLDALKTAGTATTQAAPPTPAAPRNTAVTIKPAAPNPLGDSRVQGTSGL